MVLQNYIILFTAIVLTHYIYKFLINIPNLIIKLHILYPSIIVFLKKACLGIIDIIKFVLMIIIKMIIMFHVLLILYSFKFYIDNLMNPQHNIYITSVFFKPLFK